MDQVLSHIEICNAEARRLFKPFQSQQKLECYAICSKLVFYLFLNITIFLTEVNYIFLTEVNYIFSFEYVVGRRRILFYSTSISNNAYTTSMSNNSEPIQI